MSGTWGNIGRRNVFVLKKSQKRYVKRQTWLIKILYATASEKVKSSSSTINARKSSKTNVPGQCNHCAQNYSDSDVTWSVTAFQITGDSNVCWTVCWNLPHSNATHYLSFVRKIPSHRTSNAESIYEITKSKWCRPLKGSWSGHFNLTIN